MDRIGRGDQPDEADRPAPSEASTLIEGRWRSLDEKVAWMLNEREQVDDSSELAEPASTRDAPSDLDAARTPPYPRDIRIPSEDLGRAGMPDLSDRAVTLYLATHRQERPWLNIVGAYDSVALRRAIAAMDQGGGHTLERHSTYGSPEDHQRRVQRCEDPAQLNSVLRQIGIDGLTGKDHFCANMQTRFTSTQAMVTSLARTLGDPRVQAALETPLERGKRPPAVLFSIEDLLGRHGHEDCEGFRLAGEKKVATAERRGWLRERKEWIQANGSLDGFEVDPPPVERISTFRGGNIEVRFARSPAGDRYTISSHYPVPDNEPNRG